MTHLLCLLTDLLTDAQFMHGLARNLFASGLTSTAILVLFAIRRLARKG